MKVRIPFQLNEADIDATPILMTDLPVIRFLIETPDGDVMDPATAVGLGGTYEAAAGVSFYRFTLPLPLGAAPAHPGTWHALLDIDRKYYKRLTHRVEGSVGSPSARAAHGVRYCLTVQSYSNLRMEARLSQDSMVPGATMRLGATLSEYGIPVDHRAAVRADVERPDGTQTTLTLSEVEDGSFEATIGASVEGVYRFHVKATGITLRGLPFTREKLLTGAVFAGGNNPWPTGDPADGVDSHLCELLECLLDERTFGRFFAEHNIDVDALRRCVERSCKKGRDLSDEEVREREGVGTARQAEAIAPTALSPQVLELLERFLETRQLATTIEPKKRRPKQDKEN